MIAIVFFVRLARWGIAGIAAITFVATFVQTSAFYAIAGQTASSREAFGAAMATLATQFSAIFPAPLHPETVGGYVWWRGFQAVSIVLAIWAMASATAMVRTDENRGVLESLLASGVARWMVIASRMAAFAIGAGLAAGAALLGFVAALQRGGGVSSQAGLAEAWIVLLTLALSCYAISVFVAQLVAPRFATGLAAAVLLALFLVNSLSRSFDWLSGARWLSPFRYADLNQPIVPGGMFDGRSVLVLAAIALLGGAATALAFARRDLGSPLFAATLPNRAPSRLPSPVSIWRWPVARELYARRIGLLAWAAGLAVLAVLFAWLTKAVVQPLLNIPALFPNFGRIVRASLYPTVLGYTWFGFAELLFVAFAIVQVARWAAEDVDGTLEMILSQPRSRAGVIAERMLAMLAGAALIATAAGIALFYASRSQGIELDAQHVLAASAMLVPLAFAFAAAGALLVAWRPRAAAGLLAAVAFLGYIDTEVGRFLSLPSAVQELSPFHLYGTPLSAGFDARNLAILLAISLAGLGSSILAIQRRDVGT